MASALKDILIVEDNGLVLKYVTQCIINVATLFLPPYSQAKEALLQLGYEPMAEDSMAETVCAEVKRLGSQNAITEQILASQEKQMVDYVITRPLCSLSSRDYLNEKLRYYLKETCLQYLHCIYIFVFIGINISLTKLPTQINLLIKMI